MKIRTRAKNSHYHDGHSHDHESHGHGVHRARPPEGGGFSLLRLSAVQRLGLTVIAIAMIWGSVWLAIA